METGDYHNSLLTAVTGEVYLVLKDLREHISQTG